jgi:hypothetical protein
MRYQIFACALSVFAALGCGAAEDGENVGESQEALNLLGTIKILRQNAGGNCIEKSNWGGFKVMSCTYPYPDNRKWEFQGYSATGYFRVIQSYSQTCMSARLGSFNGDTLTQKSVCSEGDAYSRWRVLPGSGSLAANTFQLESDKYPGKCIAVDGFGSLTLNTCVSTFPAADAQRLLLDNF